MTEPIELLAKNLTWLMAQAELNPNSLSRAMGTKENGKPRVPQATIFRIIERESKSPQNATLSKIADFFQVKVSDLWERDFEQSGRPVSSGSAGHGQAFLQGEMRSNEENTKAKNAIQTLHGLPDECYDGFDVLAIQNLLTRLERRAMARLAAMPDSDTE